MDIYWIVPLCVSLFCVFYIVLSLREAWKRIAVQVEASSSHSDRVYKVFEFYFTITIAIVGGIGYSRISLSNGDKELAEQIMLLLGCLQYFATLFVIIATTSHWGSKWERWHDPKTKENIKKFWWRMVEPWIIILSLILSNAVWITIYNWSVYS